MQKFHIYIDADACPVTKIASTAALEAGIPCTLLCDTAHTIEIPGTETIVVDQGADSADFALIKRLQPGDIVVTQDYGLAALCLTRGAYAIHQDGWLYSQSNIDGLLSARQLSSRLRRGGYRVKGAKKRTKEQDNTFDKMFRSLLQNRLQG